MSTVTPPMHICARKGTRTLTSLGHNTLNVARLPIPTSALVFFKIAIISNLTIFFYFFYLDVSRICFSYKYRYFFDIILS